MKPAGQLVLGTVLLLQAQYSFAQGPGDDEDLVVSYGDKATVSIVTGSEQSLRRAPAVATVITAEDIAAMGATDLDEVLETVPGVHVSRSANNYAPLYVVRGVQTQFTPQVLVMQNGVPITTLLIGNKGNLWGGYPVEHIARIEIIRGPGSALYGADAFSGVINIITKSAADTPGTQVGMRVGSFATENAWVQHGGKLGPMDVAAYLRIGSSEGFKERVSADAQTRFDRIFGTHASLAPGSVRTGYDAVDGNLDLAYDKWRVRAGYKLRDNIGLGAGIASALDPVGREKSERLTGDVSWTNAQFAPDWGVGFEASYLYYTQRVPVAFQLFPPGANIGGGVSANGFSGGPETWERQLRLSAFATYTGFADHGLRFGVGHDDLDLYKTAESRNFTYSPTGALVPVAGGALVDFSDSNPFMLPHRRLVDYVYAQDEWNFAKDWALTTGLRHDRYSDVGGTTNPRLALVWDAALDVTVKLMAGRAFRAPAFNEIYSITNPVALGNPNLRPEVVSTVEAALTWQARRDLQLNVSLFHYDMKDTIRLVGGTYFNTGTQYGDGGELEGVWDVNRSLRLTGNYSWQTSIDQATQTDAGYAPHHHVYTRADWRFSNEWLGSTQVNWVADRRRAAGDVRANIADYTTVDLYVSTPSKRKQWSFGLGLRNLFNADVREPSVAPGTALPDDLPMAPFSAYIQAVYRL
ncbi:TonB-dependent receptor plug domain-containing protein [Rhodoferax ferrireducens]|uniref:TonB-dependent receptor plug domain-containing protein n=1 Tax=Rhodoferax ferrireducens TaxID=192843 RepID=UPI000E0DD68F|nr:TonB-dependent receptor [Rhodoferax ferrireducens]